jgi:chlorite dismutase
MPYTLNAEQRRILRDSVRTTAYRDPTDGLYYVLGRPFESLEEAEAEIGALCIERELPPLSLFSLHQAEQKRVSDQSREEWLRDFRLQEKYPERYRDLKADEPSSLERTKERIAEQAKRLSWRDNE